MGLKKSFNNWCWIFQKAILVFIVAFWGSPIYSQEGKLFDPNSSISLTLRYKVKDINRDRTLKDKYHNAVLIEGKDSLNASIFNVQLKTRGIFRLKSSNCFFLL